jgi:hypothetical protein
LCEKILIDHHMTSQDQLEASGLVERMVQMVKRGLQSVVSTKAMFEIGTYSYHD